MSEKVKEKLTWEISCNDCDTESSLYAGGPHGEYEHEPKNCPFCGSKNITINYERMWH